MRCGTSRQRDYKISRHVIEGIGKILSTEDGAVPSFSKKLAPLLRRLEKQGLLKSQWEMGDSKPRKYYRRTEYGSEIYRELKGQWQQLAAGMEQLWKEEEL